MGVMVEVERKFLVQMSDTERDSYLSGHEGSALMEITQGYLSFEPVEERVRITGANAERTTKTPIPSADGGAISRREVTVPITMDEAHRLLASTEFLVEKYRLKDPSWGGW